MRRLLRIGWKVIKWTVVTLAVLITAVVIALQTDWGREQVRSRAEAALDEMIAGKVTVGKIEGNLLGDFTLKEIVIADADGSEVIGIDRIDLDYGLWSVVMQEMEIDRLVIDGVRVHAVVGDDGELNLSAVLASPGDDEDDEDEEEDDGPPSAPGFTVRAPRIEVRNVALTYDAPGQPTRRLTGLSFDLDAGYTASGVKVTLSELAGDVDPGDGGEPLELIGGLAFHRALDGAMTLTGLSLAAGGATVSIPNASYAADAETAGAEATVELPADLVRRFAPEAGLRADLRATVTASKPTAEAPLSVTARATAADASAELTAEIHPGGPLPRATGTLTVRAPDASKLVADLVPATGDATVDFDLTGDSLENASGTATVRGSGAAEGISADPITVVASLRDQIVTVDGDLAVPTGALTIDGTIALTGEVPTFDLKVTGDVDRIERAGGPLVPATGGASVAATVRGPLGDLRVTGDGQLRRFRYQDNLIPRGRFDFTLTGVPDDIAGTIDFRASGVAVGGDRMGTVRGTARVSMGGKRIAVSVRSTDPTATVKLTANAVVRLEDGDVEVTLGDYGVTGHGLDATGTGGRVSVKGEQTRIRGLELTSPAGSISVEGTISPGGADLTVVARRLDLAELSKSIPLDPPLRGTVDLNGRLVQRGRSIDADGSVVARGVGVQGDPVTVDGESTVGLHDGVARATGTLTSKQLGVSTFDAAVRAPRDQADGAAWAARTEADLVEANIAVERLDVAALPLSGPDLPTAGTVDALIKIGDGARRGTIRLTGRKVALPAARGQVDANLDGSIRDGRIELVATAVTEQGERARAAAVIIAPDRLTDSDAWIARGEQAIAELSLSAGPVQLERLAELSTPPADAVPVDEAAAPTPGSVELQVSIGPSLESARVELILRTDRRRGRPLETAVVITSSHRPQDVEARLNLLVEGVVYGRGSLRVDAGLDHARAGDIEAFTTRDARGGLTLSTLPLMLIGELLVAEEPLVGALSGEATLRGSLADPKIDGDLTALRAGTRQIRFDQLGGSLTVRGKKLRADLTGRQSSGGTIVARAEAELIEAGPVDAEITAEQLDLSILRGVLPDLGISGTLDAKLTVKGTTAAPVVSGNAGLSGGRLRPGPPFYLLEEVNASVTVAPTQIAVVLSGSSGAGKLDVDATVGLADLTPTTLSVDITLDDLPVDAGGQQVSIDSETRVRGRLVGQVWQIDTSIGETVAVIPKRDSRYLHSMAGMDGVVFVDHDAPPAQKKKKRRKRRKRTTAEPSGVRVAVRAPQTITIRGREVKAVASVDLTYDDTGKTPSLTGTVRTESGWVELFGRRYQIDRAIASFSGDFDPSLDVRLSHDFSSMSLYVGVIGTGEEPELRLTAEPPIYDEAQLLTFVLGASPDDPGGENRTLGNRAVGIASSLVTDQLQSLVRDYLPIDVLRIQLAEEDNSPEQMTVGKWLSSRLFVAYRHRFEADPDENSGEATLEYRFLRRWLLEAFVGDRASAVDIVWIRRF